MNSAARPGSRGTARALSAAAGSVVLHVMLVSAILVSVPTVFTPTLRLIFSADAPDPPVQLDRHRIREDDRETR